MTEHTDVIDFDAFRSEQAKEPKWLRLGGVDYELPPSMPAAVAVDAIRLRTDIGEDADIPLETFNDFGQAIFGEATWKEILGAGRVTLDEVPTLIEMVLRKYTERPSKAESPTSATGERSSTSSARGRGSKRTS